jgi:heme/copper-type cytochrome/quinol oxidase subunit 2
VLVIKQMPKRITTDWMAQQWRDGKRTKAKLGSYPSMSLLQAREVYKRDYADLIQKGRSIKIATDTRPGTVADLFEAYVAHLKDNDKSSWPEAEKGLNKIADTREIDALHLPIGRPIELVMTSEGVIYDFSVPAFRIMHDVLPGRYETLWFTAERFGTYHLFCTQRCGTGTRAW